MRQEASLCTLTSLRCNLRNNLDGFECDCTRALSNYKCGLMRVDVEKIPHLTASRSFDTFVTVGLFLTVCNIPMACNARRQFLWRSCYTQWIFSRICKDFTLCTHFVGFLAFDCIVRFLQLLLFYKVFVIQLLCKVFISIIIHQFNLAFFSSRQLNK